MPFFDFQLNRLSFWLGFLAATLLWWGLSRIRPLLPEMRKQARRYFSLLSQRSFTTVENYLRREVLRSSQRQHLASPLFSLDEILIDPWLLAPPAGQDPSTPSTTNSIAGQVVPYLPDWPELAAPYGIALVSPAQALKSERCLVFIGRPGSGKTVVLAQLASQICRRDQALGSAALAVPLLLHVLDLDMTLLENENPLDALVKAVSHNATPIMQSQIPRFLRAVLRDEQRRVVLMLDGLDELPVSALPGAVAYLTALTRQYPRVQIVTTASDEFLGGLTAAGFYPLTVAAWSQTQRVGLAKRWGERWNSLLLPEIKKQHASAEIETALLDSWLCAENDPGTPLEWTLRVWGAYAGDMSGSSVVSAIDAHLSRFLSSPAQMPALEALAHKMVSSGNSALGFDAMEKILSSGRSKGDQNLSHQPAETTRRADSKKKAKQSSFASQGERIIESLLESAILVEHANHQIRFSSPVFLGFLAGWKISPAEAIVLAKKPNGPACDIALQYAAARGADTGWVTTLIEAPQTPLYRGLFTVARWLRDAPAGAAWRPAAMRALAALAQNEAAPMGIRARAVAAFYVSRDPSTIKLYRQLASSKSVVLRRLALLGFGALGSPQLINDTLPLLGDPNPAVRYAACMALAAIPAEPALNAVVEVLLTGDEVIRQAAAETLAINRSEGHKVLQEAAEVDDLLTRHATVFGLAQVHEPWAKKLLEKLAIEDGQWVIRNAAAQALETYQQTASIVPPPVPQPSETPWLITFASKLGLGILPGHPATDVLLAVLRSGTVEEQVAALHWLRQQHDETVITAIYRLLYSGDEQLAEPALHALWWISATGASLPAPMAPGNFN